ncbi:hypothetical protein [Azotobacter chroococcum]|uniref:hypothetical protein n=1 Tax=Azotobacter chroococcum TaxID=353 RepID=UPI000B7889D0|nr:hypothetical protein [Azotobacter chroococcum]
MTLQLVDLGTPPSGQDGDAGRTAFDKINQNFSDGANAASRLVGQAYGQVLVAGGAAGLASTAETIDDWHNVNKTGWFMGSNLPNAPYAATWFIGHYEKHNDSYGTLVVQAFTAVYPETYTKNKVAGVWGPWQRTLTPAGLVGTVAVDGNGKPSGAVIETGSNANGWYVRFADGTQLCGLGTVVTANTAASGALFIDEVAGGSLWTFPAAFISPPAVHGHMNISVAWLVGQYPAVISNTQVRFTLLSALALSNISIGAYFMAVGRWR